MQEKFKHFKYLFKSIKLKYMPDSSSKRMRQLSPEAERVIQNRKLSPFLMRMSAQHFDLMRIEKDKELIAPSTPSKQGRSSTFMQALMQFFSL